MNAVIYTAIIGGTDALKPSRSAQGVPMVAFSDRKIACRGWDTRRVTVDHLPPDLPGHATTISRWFKLLPHLHFPDVEFSIWVDATNVLNRDLADMLPFEEDWVGYAHPHKRDVWAELDAIIRHKRDTIGNVERMRQRYRTMKVPAGLRLAPCGLIWRRHSEAMIDFGERWFREFVATGSRRDMPAWGVCQWQKPIRARLMMGDNTKNEWVTHQPHIKRVPSVF